MGTKLWTILLALTLALLPACSRPPASPNGQQSLPFDKEPPASTSFSQSLIPPTMIPEGTFLTVRLSKPLSSVSAHAGDGFEGAIDEPVVVDQQTLLPRGSKISGRVLDARSADGPRNPGYLRITLVSVNAAGRTVLIDTSSIFAKATPPNDRPPAGGTASAPSDVLFTPDRRLTFRLAQAIDLQ
ncbi:MAG: hypothetical protein WAU58_03625 [Terriglobales bacterium]